MNMPRLALLFVCLWQARVAVSQPGDMQFFLVDTTQYRPHCHLPMLYFEDDGSQLLPEFREDIYYIAGLMAAYPEMHLRVRTDGLYRRFDRRQRTLNRRRVNRVTRILHREYDIDRSRIVKLYHQPWVYRAARTPESPPLVYRRVVCDCIWE